MIENVTTGDRSQETGVRRYEGTKKIIAEAVSFATKRHKKRKKNLPWRTRRADARLKTKDTRCKTKDREWKENRSKEWKLAISG